MKLGLHISSFNWSGDVDHLSGDFASLAVKAEDGGFDRVSVMDHVWQIEMLGSTEEEMLEAYTALGFLAGKTSRVKLLTLVTGAVYRSPGLLAKMVTTLDVLSGGRAMFGVGAAWNETESHGLGLFFPPQAERFERLEEVLQICLQMWSGSEDPYSGKYYDLGRTLNSPQSITKPHPPILIGGSGEKKTLRFVAQYAQACNLFPGPDLARKLDVLRRHCDDIGRDFDEIEKTALYNFDVGASGERVPQMIDELFELSRLGFTVAHGSIAGNHQLESTQIIGEQIIPAVAEF